MEKRKVNGSGVLNHSDIVTKIYFRENSNNVSKYSSLTRAVWRVDTSEIRLQEKKYWDMNPSCQGLEPIFYHSVTRLKSRISPKQDKYLKF